MNVAEVVRLGVKSRIVVALYLNGRHDEQAAWEAFAEHAEGRGLTIPAEAVIYHERWDASGEECRIRRAKGDDGAEVTAIDLRTWKR